MYEELITWLRWLIAIFGTCIVLGGLTILIRHWFKVWRIARKEEKEFMEKYNAWDPASEESKRNFKECERETYNEGVQDGR